MIEATWTAHRRGVLPSWPLPSTSSPIVTKRSTTWMVVVWNDHIIWNHCVTLYDNAGQISINILIYCHQKFNNQGWWCKTWQNREFMYKVLLNRERPRNQEFDYLPCEMAETRNKAREWRVFKKDHLSQPSNSSMVKSTVAKLVSLWNYPVLKGIISNFESLFPKYPAKDCEASVRNFCEVKLNCRPKLTHPPTNLRAVNHGNVEIPI